MIPPSPVAGGAQARRRGYVYLLRSRKDGTFYVGWTTDVLRRLVEHNQGLSEFTRRKKPWQVVGFATYPSAEEAKVRERMLRAFKKRVLNQAADGGQRQVGE